MFREYFSFDISPFAHKVTFQPGDILIREGSYPKTIFFLSRGRAKVLLTQENGKISLVNFLDAPCLIGEMELLDMQRPARGVAAVHLCECIAIDTSRCREQLLADPVFLRKLCLYLSEKALSNTDNYAQNQSFPLQVRLARFILMTQNHLLYREKHTEAAEYLGVSYRHLLYVLADMVSKGILAKTDSGYLVKDLPALQSLAGEGAADLSPHAQVSRTL